MTDHRDAYLHAAELIAGADALVIAAGAGMGVDSGLPDFRGNEGFLKAYPALAKAQLNFTEVASPEPSTKTQAWHGASTVTAWLFTGKQFRTLVLPFCVSGVNACS